MVKEPKVIIDTFTDDEAVRMLKQWDFKSYCNSRNKAMVATLFETGMFKFDCDRVKYFKNDDINDDIDDIIKTNSKICQ